MKQENNEGSYIKGRCCICDKIINLNLETNEAGDWVYKADCHGETQFSEIVKNIPVIKVFEQEIND